jgi:hypothetical protein
MAKPGKRKRKRLGIYSTGKRAILGWAVVSSVLAKLMKLSNRIALEQLM